MALLIPSFPTDSMYGLPETRNPQPKLPSWVLQAVWKPEHGSVFHTVGEIIETNGINHMTDLEDADARLFELGIGDEVRQDASEERTAAFQTMRWAYALTGVIPEAPHKLHILDLIQEADRDV